MPSTVFVARPDDGVVMRFVKNLDGASFCWYAYHAAARKNELIAADLSGEDVAHIARLLRFRGWR
jgi:hypothetical protein